MKQVVETKQGKTVMRRTKKRKELRTYQERIINAVSAIYERFKDDQRAFICMPTGTGKTFTTMKATAKVLLSEKKKNRNFKVIWIAHRQFLNNQAYNAIIDELKGFVTFKCWQSFTKEVDSQENEVSDYDMDHTKYDMLVIDECHYGSSVDLTSSKEKEEEEFRRSKKLLKHRSFLRIIKKGVVQRHLYVSATPYGLNPKVYPGMLDTNNNPLAERTALYTMREACDDGFIAPVNTITVTTADTIELKYIDKTKGEESISGSDTKELSGKVKKKKVNLKAKPSWDKLRENVADVMTSLFVNEEIKDGVIPPTIFYCDRIGDKDLSVEQSPLSAYKIADLLTKKLISMRGGVYTKKTIGIVHSKTGEDTIETLNSFANGEFPILINVNVCREGFDYPDLEVEVDLSPNFNNTRVMQQKLGRLFRISDGKPNKVGRYYFPDTVYNYLQSKNGKDIINDRPFTESLTPVLEKSSIPKEFHADVIDSIKNVEVGKMTMRVTEGFGDVTKASGNIGINSISKIEIPDLLGKAPNKEVFISNSNLHISKVSLSKGVASIKIDNIFDYVEGESINSVRKEVTVSRINKLLKSKGK